MTMPVLDSSSDSAGTFVPDEISRELNMLIRDASCVESLAKHLPMKRSTLQRRKQGTGVDGYWVGSMEVKTKDAPTFEPYELVAKKMAVIIPLEDELIEDADSDIAAIFTEDVVGAFAEALDETYMGYRVSPFDDNLTDNTPAGNTIAFGTEVDLAGDFSLAMAALEANAFEATGAITHPRAKHIMRNMRDEQNRPLFVEDLTGPVPRYSFWGVPVCFTRQVEIDGSPEAFELLMFYKPYVIIGDRLSLSVSVSNEATLTYGTDDPVNLWEQDMSAYRFLLRKGFVVKDNNALAKITGIN